MDKKGTINNSFFDFLAFIFSFILSFFRSIKLFMLGTKDKTKINNIFFSFLDFIFRQWSAYFWKKPSFYKISGFFGDILNSIFKNK